MSTPGPTLLKSHLQAHSKDYSVTRLLTLLDMHSKPERDAFASSLRSPLSSLPPSQLTLLTPSQLHGMARTFLASSPDPRSPCNGTTYFPPAYLRNIPGFAVKKWSYGTHGEAILEVMAQILSTQRKMQIDRKRRGAAGYERPQVKNRKRRRAGESVGIGVFSGPESGSESENQPLAKRRRRPARGCAPLPPREPATPSPPPGEKTPSTFIDLTWPLTEPVPSLAPDSITSLPTTPPPASLRECPTAPTRQPNACFTSISTSTPTAPIESSTSMARPRQIRDILSISQDIYPPSIRRQTRTWSPSQIPSSDPDSTPTPNPPPIKLITSPSASLPNSIFTANNTEVQPPSLSFPTAGEHIHINEFANPFHAPSDTINGLPLFESVGIGLGVGMGIMPRATFGAEDWPERPDVIGSQGEGEGDVEMEEDVEAELEVSESEYGEEKSIRDAGRGYGTGREKEIGQEHIVSLGQMRAQARREGFEAARQVCMEIYMELHRQAVHARGQDGKEAMGRAEGALECFHRIDDVLEERETEKKT